jgi:multidrug efflux pump subunit AcrA (membrane-fusion protein)
MNAKITIITASSQNVVRIANAAVQRDTTGSFVEVKKDDGTTEKVTVQVGLADSTNTEITSGLDEGATVIIPTRTASAATTSTTAVAGGGFGGGVPPGGVPPGGGPPG